MILADTSIPEAVAEL